ncbi:MAG: hypothetical protein HY216_03140 [Candidatus Rokubacteria bacterium]|nr:hypothetical protein [Candidatus Rokubacteria bacterium]
MLANDVRGDKLGLFRTFASENSVQGVVLGTSRSMKIDPRILEDTSGARFFNFSVGNARAEDYLAIYRWVRAQRIALRMVILGLDVEAFHDDDIPDTTLEFNRELRTALGEWATSSLRAFALRVRMYKRSMGTTAFRDAVRAIVIVRVAHDSRAPQRIWPDGRLEQFERKPTSLRVCNDGMQRRYAKMTKLSPRRLARLDMLISEAIGDGAAVKVWLTPLDPVTRDHLNERTLYRELSAALRAHLANLARSVPIELFDYEDPRVFNGDPAVWDDCSHVNEADAARIAVRLIGGRG